MYLGVKSVKALENFQLLLTFENDEQRIFDVNEYIHKGIMAELKDEKMFETVHINFDTVEWDNGADLDPELLYQESKKLQTVA